MAEPLFESYSWSMAEKERLDHEGYLLLPGILMPSARERLISALEQVNDLPITPEHQPRRYAAEHEPYLVSIIGHPQMLELARRVLGAEIRFDHCVDLSRAGSDPGQNWHTHPYADERPELGFVRIFFYVNGFQAGDGGLRVVPGSHLFRNNRMRSATDQELREGWMRDKQHPETGQGLQTEDLNVPEGSVILMWTHALHAVSPRHPESETRWAVVYAYRNPGEPSHARWIREPFEQAPPAGAEGLMSLY